MRAGRFGTVPQDTQRVARLHAVRHRRQVARRPPTVLPITTELRFAVQIKEAESIFQEVDEDEYAKLVAKRRQDEFVEDDGDDLGYKDDGEEAWNRYACMAHVSVHGHVHAAHLRRGNVPRLSFVGIGRQLIIVRRRCREDDSEDEMEESSTMARKLGMTTTTGKEEKKRTDHSLSMMLQRQAQVAKAKASGSLATSGTGVKRKPEKAVEVSMDDLLADFGSVSQVSRHATREVHTHSVTNRCPGGSAEEKAVDDQDGAQACRWATNSRRRR